MNRIKQWFGKFLFGKTLTKIKILLTISVLCDEYIPKRIK